jgi:4-diphosphocytidyl-2-C-methyl-D-erythritol kinase
MIVFAPAKINLGLLVLNKRPDHYHNLDSIFYPVPLFDFVEAVVADDFSLKESGFRVAGSLEDNLLYKTWELMRDRYGIGGLKVHLHKRIPMGAGLGGGSSDASALIKIISTIYSLHLSIVEMERLAMEIGADCLFFIRAKAVRARGIGNEFNKIERDLGAYYLVLVKPDIHISTAEAYSGVHLEGASTALFADQIPPKEQWNQTFVNSFEKHLFPKYPVLANLKNQLIQMGAFYASMSGSGATIYGLFHEPPQIPRDWNQHFVWSGKL